jgi:hypothetical protein
MTNSPPVQNAPDANAAFKFPFPFGNCRRTFPFRISRDLQEELAMTFGRGALLWLLGIPLPILLLLALFWR